MNFLDLGLYVVKIAFAHLSRGTAEKTALLFDLSGDHTQNHTSGKVDAKH